MYGKLLLLISVVLLLGLVAQASDPNIVGQWKFDEPSGTTAYDSSDNNNHGTIHGGASLDGSGQLTLDGSNDYVSLPIGSVIASLTNCSFVVWVDASNAGSWQRIFDCGNNTTVNMFLTPNSGGGPLRFAITTGGSGAEQRVTASEALPSGLHRIIVTIDADNDTIKMYVDSALVAQNTSATLTPSDLGNTSNNWLGRSQYSWDAYFQGSYDEFIIYNYVLPESEILGPLAYGPEPADKAKNVLGSVVLSWLPGYGADSHDVYFGTDFNDVNEADNSWPVGDSVYKGNQTVDDCDYYAGELEGGQAYYWRIDEVNEPNIVKGDVWSFTVFDYVFEDFEDYNNSSELNLAWVPGGSASVALSTDTSHKSQKSMKLDYANSSGDYYSTAKMTFDSNNSWDIVGIEALSIYFKGSASNDSDKLYVILEDGDWIPSTAIVEYDGGANDLKKEYWQRWDIDFEEFLENNPTFRFEEVSTITIAVGDTTNQQPGGSGTIYIDDISFKGVRCLDKNKPIADFDGDCDVDINDLKHLAQQWLDMDSDADLIEDSSVDFKDYAVVADKWLGEYSNWPVPLDIDNFLTGVLFTDVDVTGGLWAERMQVDRTVTIPHIIQKCVDTGRIHNFELAGGLTTGSHEGSYPFDDTDPYKTLEAVSYSLALNYDASLDATMDYWITVFDAAMEDDGYLYTCRTNGAHSGWTGPERWSNLGSSHELYNMGHFYEAAVAHYNATGKTSMLDLAQENAELLIDIFNEEGLMIPPGHQEIEIGLMKMYHLVGDQRYFDLTKFYCDQRGNAEGHALFGTYSQDHVPLVDQDSGVGHAVRAGYFYAGAADVARVNLDQDYMNALIKVWDNIVSAKTYITGGLGQPGGPEGFTVDYDLGNNSYCETCASLAFAKWNHRMYLLTGDGKYLDMMEKSMHNNALSGISLSGNRFFYQNWLETDGRSRPDWYTCACCPPHLAKYIMSIGGYAYAHNDHALYVNLYMNGTGQILLGTNTVNLSVDTNYPWEGDIEITVTPSQAGSFPIYLRIPSWARNIPMPGNLYGYLDESSEQPTLEVNSSPVELDIEKGFAKIERTWTAGDTIHLVLPMPVRKVIAHPLVTADAGLVAIQRGPVVYCAEGVDNGGSVSGISIPDSLEFTATYEPATLNGVTVLRSTSPSITLVPYYTWANRGSSPMKVWLPREP